MLNVNETTYDVPAEVVEAIAEEVRTAAKSLNRYPDREFTTLRHKLARFLTRESGVELSTDQIWAANGSNEVMQHILQAFAGPGRSVMSFPPTYSMYPLYARGVNSDYIAGTRSEDFTQTPDDVAAQIREHRPNVVILCSPNNPTGTALELDVVEAAYRAAAESETIVVVDEAYGEFRQPGTDSALSMLSGRPRLIVTRTMSKAFAMAGGRVGYLAASPAVTDALRLVRLPYHLSAITQAAAGAALDHAQILMANVERIKTQRDRIVLRSWPRWDCPPIPRTPTSCSSAGSTTPRRHGSTCWMRASWSATSASPATCGSPPAPRRRPPASSTHWPTTSTDRIRLLWEQNLLKRASRRWSAPPASPG